MMKRTGTLFVVLSVCLIGSSFGADDGNNLRKTLVKRWKSHLQASRSGKKSEIKKTMSSYRLGKMKNKLASANRSLTPQIIRSIAEHAPDISKAEFVTILKKGPTAGLVYIKDSNKKDSSGEPRVTFVFIKFVKEDAGWKVHGGMDIGSPKHLENGEKAEFDPSDLPPTYKIDGKVRPAPEPVEPAYASAFLDVFSYGYKTEVIVNGNRQGATLGESRSGKLKGGLRKGKNKVTVVITQKGEDIGVKPKVTVHRVLKDGKTTEVFKFEPKEDVEGKHKFTVNIE